MTKYTIRRYGNYIRTFYGTIIDLKKWVLNNVAPEGDPMDPKREPFIDPNLSTAKVIQIALRKGLTFKD